MPIDPRHNRNIPAGAPIAKLLLRLWQRQKIEVLASLRTGMTPDLSRYNQTLADLVRPYILQYVGDGGNDALRRIRKLIERGPPRKRKDFVWQLGQFLRGDEGGRVEIGNDFDLFNPHILTMIQQAVLQFAASTNAMTTQTVNEARENVRAMLAQGYTQGETIDQLTRRINEIFDNRDRAWMIARTESSRAVHAGQVLAAKETGIVSGKKWLASADACKLCEALQGNVVGLDEVFTVDPKGGPYAAIAYPPRHPHCRCTFTEVLDWEKVSGKVAA